MIEHGTSDEDPSAARQRATILAGFIVSCSADGALAVLDVTHVEDEAAPARSNTKIAMRHEDVRALAQALTELSHRMSTLTEAGRAGPSIGASA